MRQIIAAMQTSLDGFIEGPNGELDWVADWGDDFDLPAHVDTCILGGGMYPGYEQYWMAILANPKDVVSLTGKVPTQSEIEYAHFADKTPHVVLSSTLKTATWNTTRIVTDIEDFRRLKKQPGRDIYAVGGAMFISSLMNLGLIDELRLIVHPLVLGGGKALFEHVTERHMMSLVESKELKSGRVGLTYGIPSAPR